MPEIPQMRRWVVGSLQEGLSHTASGKQLTPIKASPPSLCFSRASLITLLQTPFNATCTFVGASSGNEGGREKYENGIKEGLCVNR